ncbi:amine oxidase [copper-containing] 3-like isoform X1 [Ambystoma mexicanum]|uniref:amine oxidase [copper-containing] 3-like isoform X1 n=1 Tax=Ambystoma mexicanum TaxID=8296 RepID=UPI0037E9C7FD
MERMNLKIVLILLALAVATVLALVCVLLTGAKSRTCGPTAETKGWDIHDEKSLVFSNLCLDELSQVMDYLKKSLGDDLLDCTKADPSENCLFSIDRQLPKKDETLRFLDSGGQPPTREALAVVFFGAQDKPNITEFVVGPLPNPTYSRDVTMEKYKGGLPYNRRPVTSKEYFLIFSYLQKVEAPKAATFFKEVLGTPIDKEFAILTTAPRGFQSGERSTWFVMFQDTTGSGFFIHPLGIEVLVNHQSLNASQWAIDKVFYNGQYYGSMEELEVKYKSNQVKVVKIPNFVQGEEMGSLKPRLRNTAAMPLHFEPNGARYSVGNNQVLFQSWSLDFGLSVNTGMRLFNIKFKGERVAYELSVQEAISMYGSNAPGGMMTRYMDGSFGIGRLTFEMVKGVDCPSSATCVDSDYFYDNEKPAKHRNAICIFEHNPALPMRRHYSNYYSDYYGGLPSTVLVLRAIATLGNYDYVFDFLFYQNGAIEARVHATGYITSSFYFADGLNYGNRLGEYTLGTIHTHFINYKVDLDVAGTENHVVAHDMEFEAVKAPWSKEHTIHRPKLTRKVLETENQASFKLDAKMPRYIQFASKKTNKWGHERSYRLQMVSFAGDYLPEDSTLAGAMSWAKYKLAITQRKEEEPQSGCIYNQNDPWTPSVKFDDFINDENIVDKDLVAWPTIGFLHIPHAEDIPNTVTTGNGVGFLLRPYNYFKEDPSVDSGDAVYFTKDMDLTSCAVNPLACLSKTASCAPNIPPFNYTGLDNAQLTL